MVNKMRIRSAFIFLFGTALIAPMVAAQEQGTVSQSAAADQAEPAAASIEPDFSLLRGQAVYLGSVRVFAGLGVRFGTDNNVRAVPDSEPKTSNNYWLYSPAVSADYEAGGQRYEFGLSGSFRRNSATSLNDLDSSAVRLAGDNVISTRNRLGWQVAQTRAEEDFDSDLSREAGEPVSNRTTSAALTYRFGAEGAPGRIEADLGHTEKRYLNRSDITQASNSDSDTMGLRFLIRLMPKTFGFVEWQELKTNTLNDSAENRDSDQRTYSVGLTWIATAKTTGAIRVGRSQRDYERDTVRDFSGTTWQASINWSPLTYSRVSLISARSIGDSGVGTFGAVVNDTTTLAWSHAWKNYLRTTLSWSHQKASYREDPREDETDRYLAGIYYSFPRNYSLGLEVSPSKRRSTGTDSSGKSLDYDRDQYMAVFQANF
jgi:polysaccharide biosynthesis protein VpsM